MRVGRREQFGNIVTRDGSDASNPVAPAGEPLVLQPGVGDAAGAGGPRAKG